MPRPPHLAISWLQLTDLHVGQPREGSRVPAIEAAFLEDVERVIRIKKAPIDVIFFTGDIAFRGSKEEFTRATAILGRICNAIHGFNRGVGGTNAPWLIPVPGNHDLARPSLEDGKQLRDAFAKRDPWSPPLWQGLEESEAIVKRCFANYTEWLQYHPLPFPPGMTRSRLMPGDACVTLRIRGVVLGVVALNMAFLHVGDVKPGDLYTHPSQLHSLISPTPDHWVRDHHFCVLLTHHPPRWLHPTAQTLLDQDIKAGRRFDLHLFGHEHQGSQRQETGLHGVRHLCEGRSLFAAEEDGWPRMHGYTHGILRLRRSKKGGGYEKTMEMTARQGWASSTGWSFGPGDDRWGRWSVVADLQTTKLPQNTEDGSEPRLDPSLGARGKTGRKAWTEFGTQDELWSELRKQKRRWVFLSASIRTRNDSGQRSLAASEAQLVPTLRTEVIQAAIEGLATAIAESEDLGLIFGGHPSITSLLAPIALRNRTRPGDPWLCLVQDEFFWRSLVEEVGVLTAIPNVLRMLMKNRTGNDDLERMRMAMLSDKLAAAVFVGGVGGIEKEFRGTPKAVPKFVIGAGGGAAAKIQLQEDWQSTAGGASDNTEVKPLSNPGALWHSAESAVTAILTALKPTPTPTPKQRPNQRPAPKRR